MDLFDRRRAGILLHPTSLPGAPGNGDLGPEAFRFVDLLADCGVGLWQTLPLGPTHEDRSPYQCLSVHAGDVRLISLQALMDQGWLEDAELDESGDLEAQRRLFLADAYDGFQRLAGDEEHQAFAAFMREHSRWLDDYALYQALHDDFDGLPWYEWPRPLCERKREALDAQRKRLAGAVSRVRFEQFLFYSQWKSLRRYANERGILLFGDIPIFVAHDSADVWAHREWFSVDDQGNLQVVAGVPPDYFSATGQRWGNPHYRWDVLKQDGFSWWLERIRSQMEMFDLMRIDHFRGFEAYWEVDAAAETAIDGRWVKGPGESFFQVLKQVFGDLPLVAEDLGVITPEVTALRTAFGLPGMKILQFAFDGSSDNPYLPHNHEVLSVVYTGTHDNNTTLGWYQELEEEERATVRRYLGESDEAMPALLMRAALASVARLAVIPLQDVLELDGTHRMNVPGVADDNWRWRFQWDQVQEHQKQRLRDWIAMYGRRV
ncbi:MAG: 4-alpha-glucanotransferase [Thiogranum sp.]